MDMQGVHYINLNVSHDHSGNFLKHNAENIIITINQSLKTGDPTHE